MKGDKATISPIMTNSESIHQFGNNAYGKPATALNILRETVMGRELFDFAFKTYCERWAFKHPTPEDFFRTMEDASAVDLDWFWRGWFYTTDHVDLALTDIKWYQIDSKNPEVEKAKSRKLENEQPKFIGEQRNEDIETYMSRDSSLADFYTSHDPLNVTPLDLEAYQKYQGKLTDKEKELLNSGKQYYQIEFENIGGLVMPVILEFEFRDGQKEVIRIPAEIWKTNDKKVSKVFFFEKEVRSITLDPFLETADVDVSNNYWPPRVLPSKFELYKMDESQRGSERDNPMRQQKKQDSKQGDQLQKEME